MNAPKCQLFTLRLPLHYLLIFISTKAFNLLLRNKHHLLAIHILIPAIHHPHLPRRQLSPARLQRLDLRRRDPAHILLQMLVPGHNRLALHLHSTNTTNISTRSHWSCGLAVHLARHERELIGPAEQDVECGFELEHGLEHAAAPEDVQTQAGAGECDGQAADVAEVADCFCADEGEYDVCGG
jgi:hypothetical protein